MQGRGVEAARVRASPPRFFWDLSPDGSRVAYGEFRSEENDSVTILTLKDRTTRQVQLAGRSTLTSLSWAAGGRDLFVTTKRREGSDLLHVALDGTVTVPRRASIQIDTDPAAEH